MIQERILDSNRKGKNLVLIMHGCLGQSSAVLTNYEYGHTCFRRHETKLKKSLLIQDPWVQIFGASRNLFADLEISSSVPQQLLYVCRRNLFADLVVLFHCTTSRKQ